MATSKRIPLCQSTLVIASHDSPFHLHYI